MYVISLGVHVGWQAYSDVCVTVCMCVCGVSVCLCVCVERQDNKTHLSMFE